MKQLRTWYEQRLRALRDWLIAHSNPYRNLYHGDGSSYMDRCWTMPRWLLREVEDEYGRYFKPRTWLPCALRLHHIVTEDKDPHFHDHPFFFISLVLTGGYIEARPAQRDPCFWQDNDEEQAIRSIRLPGEVALRNTYDRHRIVHVLPDTWTLVLHGRAVQWWGFYTRAGKVFWKDYPSVHHADAAAPRTER